MITTKPSPADALAEDIARARNAGPALDAASITRAARIVDALDLHDAPAPAVSAVLYGDAHDAEVSP